MYIISDQKINCFEKTWARTNSPGSLFLIKVTKLANGKTVSVKKCPFMEKRDLLHVPDVVTLTTDIVRDHRCFFQVTPLSIVAKNSFP